MAFSDAVKCARYMIETENYDKKPLKPLGEYAWPNLPAERTVSSFFDRLKVMVGIDDEEPEVNAESLHQTTKERRDDVTSEPACGPLVVEIDSAIQDWLCERKVGSAVYLIVLPPCQQQNILSAWAQMHEREVLPPPDRDVLSMSAVEPIINHSDEVLVIPELASWYLREPDALSSIKSLLTTLSNTTRPCVVGCNSWAWQYLRRAVDTDSYLPHPLMFQAFDSHRLRLWFAQMAQQSDTANVRFRKSSTGQDVLALNKEGELESDYLKTLSAHSLGIPWVAWQIWRHSLRTAPEIDGEHVSSSAKHDAHTMWIVEHNHFMLAEDNQDTLLLILHALLLHGTLTSDQLENVVPISRVAAKVHWLLQKGFVDETDGNLACASAAYPAIRTYLNNAGFPVDTL